MRIAKAPICIAAAASAIAVLGTSFVTGHVDATVGPDVVISELMINPKDVYDSRGEWIELHNRGDAAANLAGWRLTDGRLENVALPKLTIGPGERRVLTRHADPFVNGGAQPDWVYGNRIVLLDAGDRLILWNAKGEEQDRVDWYPGSGITVPNGRSLALVRPDADGSDPTSWCASTGIMIRGDLGSPGQPNSCAAAAESLVITEVMQNPRRTSDASGEWFELFNPGDRPVDLKGWTIKDDDHDRFVVPQNVIVPAHGYAVLANSGVANGGIKPDYVYGAAMHLQNDWDELAIADASGILVDRIAWDNGRTFPDPDGASMSLIDPATDNSRGSAWCAATSSWATGDRGTPHAPSWCVPPGSNPIVITEVMFDPETPRSERASEWFEIANLGAGAIDLTGWTITAGDFKVHKITGLVVQPGSYAVLAASGDTKANGDVVPDYVYGTTPDLPLYNASGRVILKNPAGSIINRVEWSAAKHFPIPSGASITLGFPTANNTLGTNWCASNERWAGGDFGTPGEAGSCEPPPAPPAITVSEVMRNPAVVSDSTGEWFEVHNAGSTDVDLRGWSITDGASDSHVVRSSVIVPAGGYAVLGRATDLALNGGAPVAYGYGNGFVLSNDDDRIVLRDEYDQLVDEVRWARGDGFPRPNGASVARVTDGWCISGPQFGFGDLGTPGVANDCTPLPHVDVVISEIHVDPDAVSDTVGEWIELTNRTDEPVDLSGWVLRDDDTNEHVIASGPVIAPGGSVVLGRDLLDSVTAGAGVDYSYGTDFPLTNSDDEITLLDARLVWVDRVTWTVDRPLPARPGASASLRTLAADNSDVANWCTSVTEFGHLGELGTPGEPNVCELPDPAATSTTSSTSTTTSTTTTPPATPPSSTTTTTTATTTTSTTTTPPANPARTLSSGYVLLALGDATCATGLAVSGSQIDIKGGVRSNGNIMLQGSSVSVGGTVSYAGNRNIGGNVVLASVVQEQAPVPAGFSWTVADFAPGGPFSVEPGYVAHSGDWTVNQAAAGIHYVNGNVTISHSSVDLRGVTIVATGTVTISGSNARLASARADLPTVLAGGGSCHQAAINLSGSSIEWEGVLAAPSGLAQINGSKPRGGEVMALAIQISGSDIRFD